MHPFMSLHRIIWVKMPATRLNAECPMENRTMNKRSAIAALLAAVLSCFVGTACAADFYVIYFSLEEESALILDPTSVVATQDHHMTAHIANISAYSLWNDETMEMDCAGKRWKTLSSISHLASGDSIDHSTETGAVEGWEPIDKASVAGHEFDIICNWPDSKAHLELYQSPDFQTAKKAISTLFSNQK
jgi:hypothetical protein